MDLIYPPRCIVCSNIIPMIAREKIYVCELCETVLEYNTPDVCSVCGKPVVAGVSLCAECETENRLFEKNCSVLIYAGITRSLIYRFKYGGRSDYKKGLGKLLCEYIKDKDFISNIDIVIPVPIHPDRLKKRGYNQAQLLSREVAHCFSLPHSPYALIRVKQTVAQASLGKSERAENMKGSMAVNKNFDPKDKNILIIDDIFTTGSTINACCEPLIKQGAKSIFSLTLAIVLVTSQHDNEELKSGTVNI